MGNAEAMTIEDHTAIHAAYCQCSGRAVVMSMQDHGRWNLWKAHGWTEADLRLVVRFIQRRIKAGRRYDESLRLHNLLEPGRFADDLLDSKAEQRQPRPTPRQAVLKAVGRQEPESDRCVSAGQALERTKLAERLRRWRESL